MNATRFPNGFSEKNIFWFQQPILGLKMMCPCNFGSSLGSFLKFCAVKGAKSYMDNLLRHLLRHLEGMGHFLARKWCALITLDQLYNFF